MPHPFSLPRLAILGAALPLAAVAQSSGWQACTAVGDATERLACFDRWTEAQRAVPAPAASTMPETAPASTAPALPGAAAGSGTSTASLPPPVITGPWRNLRLTSEEGCHDTNYSTLSRFWELEPGSNCGTFGIRGYRPLTLAVARADTINRQPTSGNPVNNATSAIDYRKTETRLQLSVRTKVAQGLVPALAPQGTDSLWVGYTQQSYWQVFNPGLSRPFRSTDHEPELIYVLPLQGAKDGDWRLRFGGLGLVHQSNGQSLPYSRSWNRVYLMAGAEGGPFQLQGRLWHRLPEDAVDDDNPRISDYVGRGELRAGWQVNKDNQLAVTGRHSLRSGGRGSVRLEWFRALGDAAGSGGLQLHTQLFTGYGDSLLDYNRKRTVFTIGFSLVEW